MKLARLSLLLLAMLSVLAALPSRAQSRSTLQRGTHVPPAGQFQAACTSYDITCSDGRTESCCADLNTCGQYCANYCQETCIYVQ